MLAATPGLSVEVDGYTDLPGSQREALAEERAQEVRRVLTGAGFSGGAIVARGMGSQRPLGPNSSASGRELNRRVEIVITGEAIGNFPLWDKSYPLSSSR